MLHLIEINNSLLGRDRPRNELGLRNISNEWAEPKKALAVKEYSNKFLRDGQFNARQKENEKMTKNNRLNSLITKHKFFRKKFTGPACRHAIVCKTEPNENEYKCFMTSNNFYKEAPQCGQVQTEGIPRGSNNLFFEFENEEWRHSEAELDLKGMRQKIEGKVRSKCEVGSGKMEEKISASRALEMYAKIISKDRSDLIEKIRFSNQRRSIKDKVLESKKNLEICQMNLQEKQKKSIIADKPEKAERKERSVHFRKKTRSVDLKLITKEEDNF